MFPEVLGPFWAHWLGTEMVSSLRSIADCYSALSRLSNGLDHIAVRRNPVLNFANDSSDLSFSWRKINQKAIRRLFPSISSGFQDCFVRSHFYQITGNLRLSLLDGMFAEYNSELNENESALLGSNPCRDTHRGRRPQALHG
jgi:hypothetical protein